MKKTTLISALFAIGLVGCSDNKSAESHIQSAKEFLVKKDYNSSIIELKNAVRLEPKNAQARFLLGEAYLAQGSSIEAIKELNKAKEYKYNTSKLLILIARAHMLSNETEELNDLIQKNADLADEIKVELLAYQAISNIKQGLLTEAKVAVEQAKSISKSQFFTLLAEAYLINGEGELDKADAALQRLNTLNDSNPENVMLNASVTASRGDYKSSIEHYKKYLELQPEQKNVYLLLAEVLLKNENYSEAEKYVNAILASYPNQPFANFIKSVVKFSNKSYQEASDAAEIALNSEFKHPHLKLVAGVSAFYLKNYEQANFHLKSIVELLDHNHPARKMFALSQLELGQIEDIAKSLSDFEVTSKEDQKFLSSLSFNLYSIGAKNEANALASKVKEFNRDTPENDAQAGFLKLMMNDPTAIANLEKAYASNENLKGVELSVAYAALMNSDFERAHELVNKWLNNNPESASGYNLLATIYIKQKDIKNAKTTLEKSLQKDKENLHAFVELAKIYLLEKNQTKAEEYADLAIKKAPDSIKAIGTYYLVNKNDKGLNLLNKSYIKQQGNLEIAQLYALALFNNREVEKALSVISSVDKTINTPISIWMLIIHLHRENKDLQAIQSTAQEWIKTNPYHVQPVLISADIAARTRQQDKAIKILSMALTGVHKENQLLKMSKMQLLLDTRKTVEAELFYKSIKSSIKNLDVIAGIEGRLALLMGDYKNAASKLGRFFKVNPSSQVAALLSVALKGNKQEGEALVLLEGFLKKNPDDLRIRNLLANNYLQVDKEKAIKEYEEIIKAQPLNVVALNNLAWMYKEKGEYTKALAVSKQAYEIFPNNPNVVDTRGMVLFKAGELVNSWEVMAKAFELSNGKNNEISFNYAEVLIANKQHDKAMKVLNNIQSATNEEIERKALLVGRIDK